MLWKWEHETVVVSVASLHSLLGMRDEAGWELVSAVLEIGAEHGPPYYRLFFKRPKVQGKLFGGHCTLDTEGIFKDEIKEELPEKA